MKRSVCLFLAVSTSLLAVSSSTLAIVNGVSGESRASYGSAVRIGSVKNAGCSAVLISDTVALTAAHCFKRDGTFDLQMHMQKQGTKATPCITWSSTSNKCTARKIEVLRHPKWKGSGDTESDIAVLHIKNNKFRLKNGPIPKDHFARLYSDRWQKSRKQIIAGFGPNNPSGAGDNEYHESRIYVTNFYDHHYFNKSGPNSRICKGDSGGPAFLRNISRTTPIVVGLAVSIQNNIGQDTCVELGKKQRWVKISPKVDWISDKVRKFTGRPCRAPFMNQSGVDYRLCFD